MRHEEATDSAQPIAEDERPRGLNALRFKEVGLGVSFIPDESDLNGSVTYGHDRMTMLVAELFRRSNEYAKSAHRVGNFLNGLPRRQEHEALCKKHEALLADVELLRERIAALESQRQERAA